MNSKILVCYASKHGATREIAEEIQNHILRNELEVDCMPVEDVEDPGDYETIVLGSAVYVGMWRKKAVRFLKKYQDVLKDKNVWLFSSGPTGEGDPVENLKGWKYPKSLEELISIIKPLDISVFGGALSPSEISGLEKWMIKKVKAPTGDFRDWQVIQDWADSITTNHREKIKV